MYECIMYVLYIMYIYMYCMCALLCICSVINRDFTSKRLFADY